MDEEAFHQRRASRLLSEVEFKGRRSESCGGFFIGLWVQANRNRLAGMKKLQLTGLLEREGDGYVSLCPELDVASQGSTVDEALANLREAVELFLETAAPGEIENRFHPEVIVSRFEASYA